MAGQWLSHTCQAYRATVLAMGLFSFATLAWCRLFDPSHRGYKLVLELAMNVATLGSLLLAIVGGALCALCLASKMEPPHLLVRYTSMSLILFALNLLFLPAIAVS